ncbi:hypothetical protein ABQE93_10945 [Mycolicibacterium sp. XJ662]
MDWGWLIPTATVVPAILTLVTFLVSVPFSPARYWAWRLRRQGETVAALDPERHRNQREALLCQTDYLADRAVAAAQIPTPWKRYTLGIFAWTHLLTLGLSLVILDPPPARAFGEWAMIAFFFYAFPVFGFTLTFGMWQYIRSERVRFVRSGFPPNFRIRRDPWIQMWRDYERRENLAKALQRAKRMDRTGLIPPRWRPRAPHVRLWRRTKPTVRRILFGIQAPRH